MKTVRELSRLTGISVRTLHYYDQIGLLSPTARTEAGYRLYDDKALETLQQILFFREFDIPLKEIKKVLTHPALDRNQILTVQRNMLVAKKERLERLITGIDRILKGETMTNFEIFSSEEIEGIYHSMVETMSEEQKTFFISQYGSMDGFREHFLESASSEQAQKNFQKIVEWYGSKEDALNASRHPGGSGVMPAFLKRLDAVQKKLAGKLGTDVHSFEVKELIGEYDFLYRQLYQMKDVSGMLLELAELYLTNEEIQKAQDTVYGKGTTKFFGEAIQAFYRKME